ncbi:MAG: glutathione S-transferase family protein [Holosporales bacterium]|nr:glutathione S-transferase family protein [Holosporales bacterium]
MRTLYYYPLCAFSRTALLSLAEKKLDFATEITKFWDKTSPLLELNSFGRLPVLIDLNGSIVSGVYATIEYLEDAYDHVKLLGPDLSERAEARRIFQWMNEDFAADVTAPLVLEKDIKRYFPKSSPSSIVIKQIKDALCIYLKQLEQFAAQRNWLAGNTLSIADLTAAAHISVIDYLGGVSWAHFPVAKEWYTRVKSRPSFKRILSDRVLNIQPASHYANLDF